MKSLLFILGLCVLVGGILTGIYVGFWVMLVGGFVEIINAIKAPVTEVSALGFGILKMFFASVTVTVIVWCSILVGGALIVSAD